jgi:CPA1 family monovalent cation:H+ antiporter
MGASLLNGNDVYNINIHNIESAVRHIDFYDFLINGVICFILTSSALKFKISDLKVITISILAYCFSPLRRFLCWVTVYLPMGGWLPSTLPVLLLLGAALGATDPIGVKGY